MLKTEILNQIKFGGGDSPGIKLPDEFSSLNPDHTLLENFQNSLKEFYQKQLEDANNEINSLEKHLKSTEEYHSELEKKIGRQQDEIKKSKIELEDFENMCSKIEDSIEIENNNLKIATEKYNEIDRLSNAAKAEEEKLQIERQNLGVEVARLNILKEKTYLEKDSAQCIAKRMGMEKATLKSENYQIDLLISQLQEHLYIQKEKSKIFKAQCSVQQEELKDLRHHLVKTKTELKAVLLDNNNLLSMWKEILNNIADRTNRISKIQELIKEQQGKLLTGNSELNELKNRFIRKELEKNEFYNINKKQIASKLANNNRKKEKLNFELQMTVTNMMTLQNAIHELEKQSDISNIQLYEKEKIIADLKVQIQRAVSQCKELENAITKILEETLSRNNAFKDLNKKLTSWMEKLLELTSIKTETENEASRIFLDVQNVHANINELQLTLNKRMEIINEENCKLAENEKEIQKSMMLSSAKQKQIAVLTKKLNDMISVAGGIELGPLEREIENYKHDIDAFDNKYLEVEKLWKKQQTEMINLCDETETCVKALSIVSKEIAILEKKRENLEENYKKLCALNTETKKKILNGKREIECISILVQKQNFMHDNFKELTLLSGNDWMNEIKNCKLDNFHLEKSVENLRNDIKRLENEIKDKEQEIFLWERKFKLALETQQTLHSNLFKEEFQAMEIALHNLKNKKSNLEREQTEIMLEQQKEVEIYATLTVKLEFFQNTVKKYKNEKFYLEIENLQRTIKNLKQDIAYKEEEIIFCTKSDYQQKMKDIEFQISELLREITFIDTEIYNTESEIFMDLMKLILKQEATKFYEAINNKKYIMSTKTDEFDSTLKREETCLNKIKNIFVDINEDYPNLIVDFENILNCIESSKVI